MGHQHMSARYLTSDPTQSLALSRDGRPVLDFAAAPSLFLEEDIKQEYRLLSHRQSVYENLQAAEIEEAKAVASLKQAEGQAEQSIANERVAAAHAAETREIEVRAVEQRSAIEAAYSDAEMQARAAIARAQELREMLQSARLSRSALRVSVRTLLLLPSRLLWWLARLRLRLWSLAAHRTVHTASASPWRLRHTVLHQSTP